MLGRERGWEVCVRQRKREVGEIRNVAILHSILQ